PLEHSQQSPLYDDPGGVPFQWFG
ncbi:MAG: hypothetical protein EZS28_045291, partial [Streblomastix strix]